MEEYLTQRKVVDTVEERIMRSAVLVAPKKFELKEVEIPQVSGDEVLVKLQGCGVCASSIPVWEGREWFNYPQQAGSPGHEGYGIVEEVGDNVKDIKRGDRVAIISNNAFAEYDVTPASNVVKLPESLENTAFPGEALGCAMNIFNRAEIRAGDIVAIVGIGFLGALLIQLATKKGATVIAVSRRDFSLELAGKMGAAHCISMDNHQKIIDRIKEITKGRFCDIVIEATGKQWPLDLAGELTAVRGRLVIAGFHQDGLRNVNMQLWNWRGLDVINAHERDPEMYTAGIKQAIAAGSRNDINVEEVISHQYKLSEINQAFKSLTERPDGFVKAVITMG